MEKFNPPKASSNILVRTPASYFADDDTRVHVIEDIENGIDLRAKLTSQIPSVFQSPYIASLGFAIGDWLWKWHDWATEPEQAELQLHARENRAMRELKGRVTYGVLLSALEKFPDILEPYRKVLEYTMQDAGRDFQKPRHEDKNWGIIHGDLWAGK